MSNNAAAKTQVESLKQKLDAAISSRTAIENDFQSQLTLLVNFIGKLSQTCKGMDITLDNKLASLRTLLTKAAPLADIEIHINNISQLLQQYSSKNDKLIREIHDEFIAAGLSLQKISGLAVPLRRELRALLKECDERKDALILYIPLFSKLLSCYDQALQAKDTSLNNGLLNLNIKTIQTPESSKKVIADKLFIERFLKILNELVLSDAHNKHIASIKSKLAFEMSNDSLLDHFFEAFDVILKDLQLERSTAKLFLSTLSETLSTVQSAVKSTLLTNNESRVQHNELNELLQKQISNMASGLTNATSLADIKIDINDKLQLIAGTLDKKTSLELSQQQSLEKQMNEMALKVDLLEAQSKTFEKRIREQQAKSMQDALTKLGNRAAFDDYFSREMVRFHHKKFELAIAVMDLDNFKRINDTYGHTAGDKTLQVIASKLQKQMGEHAFLARYGGEEFVVIFSHMNKKEVLQALEKLREQVMHLPFKFKNNKVTITISVGVTHVNDDDNIHLAFERADTALYKAKNQGKNQVIYS